LSTMKAWTVAEHLDRIHIRDLQVRCIIGINADERVKRQDVIINVTLEADLRRACATDDIADTVDYKAIKTDIAQMVEASDYFLLERLAERVAGICLKANGVQRARVLIEKPGALRFARSIGVEIVRERSDD